MSTLESIRKDLHQALKRLDEVLAKDKTEEVRDSAVLRFEIAYELTWKFLKLILQEQHGIECRSPKSCLREAYQQGIIDYDQDWLDMVDIRNRLTHIYSLDEADEVYERLPEIRKRLTQLEKL